MIVGIGLDIIELCRFGEDAHPRLEERLLTPRERALLPVKKVRRKEYLAGRFAAKEAVAKAAGVGIGKLIGWHDIEVLYGEAGHPRIVLSEEVINSFQWQDVRIHVSITHSRKVVAAQAIIEKRPSRGK